MNATSYQNIIERNIRRVASRYSVNLQPQDIEDIRQETLLVLWEHKPQKPIGNIEGYVAKVAQNVSIDALRWHGAKKRGPRRKVSTDDIAEPPGPPATPETELLSREALALLLCRVQRVLSAHNFRVIRLVYLHGLTSNEAATLLGCTQSAIDTSISRARRTLRQVGIELESRRKG